MTNQDKTMVCVGATLALWLGGCQEREPQDELEALVEAAVAEALVMWQAKQGPCEARGLEIGSTHADVPTGGGFGEPESVQAWQTWTCEITAYCPGSCCCGNWADGDTASGHVIQAGDKLAACDRSIPFGTLLDIPGYGQVRCEDRGGAIKGDRIDVLFDTHQEALEWGRRKQVEVRILHPSQN